MVELDDKFGPKRSIFRRRQFRDLRFGDLAAGMFRHALEAGSNSRAVARLKAEGLRGGSAAEFDYQSQAKEQSNPITHSADLAEHYARYALD